MVTAAPFSPLPLRPPRLVDQLHGGDGRELLAQLLRDGHAHSHDAGSGAGDPHFHDRALDRYQLQPAAARACRDKQV